MSAPSSLTPAHEALRALAAAATPGEWFAENDTICLGRGVLGRMYSGVDDLGEIETAAANAAYIAAANPATVLALLDELAAARGALDRYGDHHVGCPTRRSYGNLCDCGFSEALVVARAHLATPADEGEGR